MPIFEIITLPSKNLRKRSKEIDLKRVDSRELAGLISSMVKTMMKADGVGLAAPQIGKNIRLAIINSKDGAFPIINPKIVKKSWAKLSEQEGCLSVPGIFGNVKRFKTITVSYYDPSGKKLKIAASGMMARVFQHEIDHLDGILFIDKATELHEAPKEK